MMTMTALTKVPFLGVFFKWAIGKGRLILEYALLAGLVVMAGLMLAMYITRAGIEQKLSESQEELRHVNTRLGLVESVNEAQETTIGTLRDLRETDGAVIASLIDSTSDLTRKDSSVRTRLAQLEKTNDKITALLDTPVDPELACLLEPRCRKAKDAGRNEGGDSVPAGTASSKMR